MRKNFPNRVATRRQVAMENLKKAHKAASRKYHLSNSEVEKNLLKGKMARLANAIESTKFRAKQAGHPL